MVFAAAGLMCRSDRNEAQTKLLFCNTSLIISAWMKVFPLFQAKGSLIYLERGIALVQIGQEQQALNAFERALHDARAKKGSWENRLHKRVSELKDRRVIELWSLIKLQND